MSDLFPHVSSYAYGNNNPLRFTDPTGMAPYDWIKNLETDEYVWDHSVNSVADTPEGFAYVGTSIDDVAADFNASKPWYDFWSKPSVDWNGHSELSQTEEGFWDRVENNAVGNFGYNLVNPLWVTAQTLNPVDGQVTHLNGNLTTHNERLQAGAESIPIGYVAGKTVKFARYGGELSFGKNFRIAPFGNRTVHPTGRFPHYHRRFSSNPRDGQGIGRHRPWDTNSYDRTFWDRF